MTQILNKSKFNYILQTKEKYEFEATVISDATYGFSSSNLHAIRTEKTIEFEKDFNNNYHSLAEMK